MEMKDVLSTGKKFLEEALTVVAAKTAETIEETIEYAKENRLMPGAKDEYIAQLEEELEQAKKENRMIRRQIARKNWQRKARR